MDGDGIPPIILQCCAAFLIEPVYHLVCQCLSQSYLPKEWSNHYITPIPKFKERFSVTNYCPISLLHCLSKVLERLVFDKFSDIIFENYISDCQFGFVSNRSKLKQLLLYQNFLFTSFDKVLIKLWTSGITGSLWYFFKCYLTDRQQCVVVENELSFNVSKSCLLRFYIRARNVTYVDYTVNGTDIVSQNHCKDLGVIFSSDLWQTKQYHSISTKAYQNLGLIRRSFSPSLPTHVKKTSIPLIGEAQTDLLFTGMETPLPKRYQSFRVNTVQGNQIHSK